MDGSRHKNVLTLEHIIKDHGYFFEKKAPKSPTGNGKPPGKTLLGAEGETGMPRVKLGVEDHSGAEERKRKQDAAKRAEEERKAREAKEQIMQRELERCAGARGRECVPVLGLTGRLLLAGRRPRPWIEK